ncbi:MAG: AraC family transcriptional regulator [Saccharofermentans sp.]|nr:AraC family transcriptional regulator [Saccharofermentans sp.]
MDIAKELERQLQNERDSDVRRTAYDTEIRFYGMISSGDLEGLKKYMETRSSERATRTRKGVLSKDYLQSEKYHTTIMTALISRFCIEAGMDIELSYSLSDIFIRKVDLATTTEEVWSLNDEISLEYCKRMRDLSKKHVVSRYVVLAIDFIRAHIQENLTVEQVANALSVNSSYLSKLFKKDMGKSISEYIRDGKIEIAENMLRHLDDSSLEIANYLGFSSQSHFIQVFKKQTGMTPEEYRKKHYHKSWIGETEEQKGE